MRSEQLEGKALVNHEADERRRRSLELGSVRGRLTEMRTQVERAEQDVALGRRWWWSHHLRARRSPPPGTERGPLVSVITPVYRTEPEHLTACLASVVAQTYRDWEHVLVDDGSVRPEIDEILQAAQRSDHRIRVVVQPTNGGIVTASNAALDVARGAYVAMLDHDDALEPQAIDTMVRRLEADPEVVFAYSDNDVLRADGRLAQPFYKPDFSPERLRNQNYILHFVVARAAAVADAGGFRAGFDGAQDHDLVLRLSELGRVAHVPELLYHWREAPESVASDPGAKPYAYVAGRRAVAEHCERIGLAADVDHGVADGLYRIRRRASSGVTAVVPTRGSSGMVWGRERCYVVDAVRSLLDGSVDVDLDVVVVADVETPAGIIERLAAIERVRMIEFDAPFNFSAKCNLGARSAAGGSLLFLNDDTELIEPRSVAEMCALAAQPDVGLVGAKLLFEDGTMQHAGHVYPGLCTHALLGYPGDTAGPYGMCLVERECSGVTAAAALVDAAVFDAVGGFDEALANNFNDVDLSLRLVEAGYRNIWTPHASWFHFESATREPATGDAERDLLLSRWGAQIETDPFHNPNLTPHRSDWLERPGRSGAPPYYVDERGTRRFS